MDYAASDRPPQHDFQTSPLPWFAVRVKSNFERTTARLLDEKGYRHFLPTYSARTRWSDRIKTSERVVFPGYLFCSFDPHQRLPILSTPGVVHVVGIGREPEPIPDQEIARIQAACDSGLAVTPWPYLERGDLVRVECGPLQGVEGIFIAEKNACRLVVSVEILKRSVAVELDRGWVRPIATPHRAFSSVGVERLVYSGSPAPALVSSSAA